MGQKGDIEKIPGLMLNTIETLVLVNEIRAQIDKGNVSECLFVNDGPLRVEDHELARSILLFLRFIHKSRDKLHIVSQEKSGRFYDHIEYLEPHLKAREIFIPSDEYIQSEIQRRDENRIKKRQVVYGSSHNLGIKVYAKFGERQTLILNVPSIMSPSKKETMRYNKIMNLSRVISTIEEYSLNSNRIKWIEFAHSSVSMSRYEYEGLVRNFFGELP